eukprot:gene20266-32218_t
MVITVLVACCTLLVSATPTTDDNMNGNDYLLQATPNGQGAVANWSTKFKDYPGGVEYFE